MVKRDVYITMVLLAVFIGLSIVSGEYKFNIKGERVNGFMEKHLLKK